MHFIQCQNVRTKYFSAFSCGSAPCVNGGTCVDEGANFTCTCVPGYEGNMCQSGKPYENELTVYNSDLPRKT